MNMVAYTRTMVTGHRPAVPFVFCAVLTLDLSSFAYDLLRPTWHAREHYAYVLAHGLLFALIAWSLLPRVADRGLRLIPPDVRVAVRGPDPLLTLRAFACLLVLLGHYFAVVFPAKTLAVSLDRLPWYQFVVSSPWAGVWIFFSLSGYLMGKGFFSGRYLFNTEGLRRFYLNRLLRIYPVYAVTILIVALLRHPNLLTLESGWNVLQALVFDASGTDVMLPVGALWSISAEFQFYLVAPFLAFGIEKLGATRRVRGTWIVLLLLAGGGLRYYAMTAYGAVWPSTMYMPFGANLDLFLVGMLMAKIVRDRREKPLSASGRRALAALLALPVFYGVISVTGAQSVFRNTDWALYTSFWPGASAVFAVCAIYAFETTDLRKAYAKRPILLATVRCTQMFGVLTFCIYVWHEPVFLALRSNLPASLTAHTTLSMFVPAITLSIALAAVFYWLVERPFESMKV